MRKRESPELTDEKKAVAELYASNRQITSGLQVHYRELTGRARGQTSIWDTDSRISHDHDSEYMTLLRTVTSTEKEIVSLLTEKVEENRQMQHLRSETSERDQYAMMSLYEKLRAAATKEAEVDLPRLQALNHTLEQAVAKLEEFVQSCLT
jgi:hypothetical protein